MAFRVPKWGCAMKWHRNIIDAAWFDSVEHCFRKTNFYYISGNLVLSAEIWLPIGSLRGAEVKSVSISFFVFLFYLFMKLLDVARHRWSTQFLWELCRQDPARNPSRHRCFCVRLRNIFFRANAFGRKCKIARTKLFAPSDVALFLRYRAARVLQNVARCHWNGRNSYKFP